MMDSIHLNYIHDEIMKLFKESDVTDEIEKIRGDSHLLHFCKMVNKRGLSPDEYFNLDAEVLDMLMIYDAYIEPSGIHIDMLKHAYQCYYSSLNSSTLTPEAKKNLKVSDYDFLDVLNPTLSTREKAEKEKPL